MNVSFLQELYADNKWNQSPLRLLEKLPVELIDQIFDYVLPTKSKHVQKLLKKHVWKKNCALRLHQWGTLRMNYLNENNVDVHIFIRDNSQTISFAKVVDKELKICFSVSSSSYSNGTITHYKSSQKF